MDYKYICLARLTTCRLRPLRFFRGIRRHADAFQSSVVSYISDIYELLSITELHLHASSYQIHKDRYDQDKIDKLFKFKDKLCNQKNIYFISQNIKRPGRYKHDYVWYYFVNHLLFSKQNDSPQTIGFHNRFMRGERRQRVVY